MLKRTIGPTTYSVTVDEVKDFIKMQGSTYEDHLIESMIKAADLQAENYMKRALLPQTWQIKIDDFPGSTYEIVLARPPLSSSSSNVTITYVVDSTAGTSTTFPSTSYVVDYFSEPGRLYPSYESEWPTARGDRHSVTITYICGYENQAAIPEDIKTWVKLRVASMFENRESFTIGSGNFLTEQPRSFVDGLLDQYSLVEVD